MKTGIQGLALIKKKEKFMARLYRCQAGYPTIGYGHVILESEKHLRTAVLTEPEAAVLLAKDVRQYEQAVSRAITAPLTQTQFDALVTLCFNIGAAGFAGATVARKINARTSEATIREAWSAWNKITDPKTGKKIVSNGLTIRRQEEADLYFSKK